MWKHDRARGRVPRLDRGAWAGPPTPCPGTRGSLPPRLSPPEPAIRLFSFSLLATFAFAGCLDDLSGTRCDDAGTCGADYVCDRPSNTCQFNCSPGTSLCGGGRWCALQCEPGADGGADAGAPDAGADAGVRDGGAVDAGEVDAGEIDAGPPDAGAPDAGVDAGPVDAGSCQDGGAFSTVLQSPTAISIVPSTQAWKNLTATGAIDADSAYTEPLIYQQVSEALVVKNLGLSISPSAEVLGITVKVRRGSSGSSAAIVDREVRLLKPGNQSALGVNKTMQWPPALGDVSYGGPSDTWGSTWTPADINSPEFGFSLVVRNQFGSAVSPQVDSVTVTVTVASPDAGVGPLSPNVVISGVNMAGTSWSNQGAAAVSDNARASVSLASFEATPRLIAADFRPVVPVGGLLSGVLVEVQRRCTPCSGALQDTQVSLTKSGVASGDNKASTSTWGGTDEWVRYGGLRDTWGAPFSGDDFTLADTGFLVTAVGVSSGATTAEINAMQLTLFFGVSNLDVEGSGPALSVPIARQWQMPGSALEVDGTRYASVPLMQNQEISDALTATGFGFQVPNNATVTGVEVQVTRKATATGAIVADHATRLVQGGSQVGANRANMTTWATTDQTITYGGAADRLGLTLLGPADVNRADFGVSLAVDCRSVAPQTALVDGFQMRVHYTCPGP